MADQVESARGFAVPHRIGTMIEVPRAARRLTRSRARRSSSPGTNDLTQMTWGFSRDDVEAAFFPAYLTQGILAVSPFQSLDTEGVGSLITTAVTKGRRTRPELTFGVCGEHGGDPDSIHFFEAAGLDYVSRSPLRIPCRPEAARAVLFGTDANRLSRGSCPITGGPQPVFSRTLRTRPVGGDPVPRVPCQPTPMAGPDRRRLASGALGPPRRVLEMVNDTGSRVTLGRVEPGRRRRREFAR